MLWGFGGRKELSERIAALEMAEEGHKRGLKLLRNEWEEVLDRMNRTASRLNARIRKSEALSAPSDDAEGNDQPPAPPPMQLVGTHTTLRERRIRRGLLSG